MGNRIRPMIAATLPPLAAALTRARARARAALVDVVADGVAEGLRRRDEVERGMAPMRAMADHAAMHYRDPRHTVAPPYPPPVAPNTPPSPYRLSGGPRTPPPPYRLSGGSHDG